MSTDVEMTADEESSQEVSAYAPSNYDLVTTIAYFLSNKVKAHDIKFQTTKNPKTHFTTHAPPAISIGDYMFHLIK